jgi:hypothetical protein
MGFTPRHECLAGKAGIGAQHDLDPGPAHPDLVDDPLDLVLGPGRGVDVRPPELGREQVLAAEHVERQVAVAIVVAVEEAAFLVAVQRIVGRIEIEDDLARGGGVAVEEEIDEQALDRRRIVTDLVITAGSRRRVLEPVQRAFTGEWGTVLAPGDELAGQRRQHRIVAQLIMVDQILVAQRDPEHPLRYHRRNAVLDLRLCPAIDEAGGEPGDQADRAIGRAEQQRTGIRGHLATVESGDHPAALDHFIPEQIAATLCRHRGTPLHRPNCLSQKSYRRFRPRCTYPL